MLPRNFLFKREFFSLIDTNRNWKKKKKKKKGGGELLTLKIFLLLMFRAENSLKVLRKKILSDFSF